MAWSPGKLLPYDGWYNGNVDLMIINGTYADFRPKLEERVKFGHYDGGKLDPVTKEPITEKGAELLKKWDAEWSKVSDSDKESARAQVIDDTTKKLRPIKLPNGQPVMRNQAVPSENGRGKMDVNKKKRGVGRVVRKKSASGNPLLE